MKRKPGDNHELTSKLNREPHDQKAIMKHFF